MQGLVAVEEWIKGTSFTIRLHATATPRPSNAPLAAPSATLVVLLVLVTLAVLLVREVLLIELRLALLGQLLVLTRPKVFLDLAIHLLLLLLVEVLDLHRIDRSTLEGDPSRRLADLD